MSETEELNPNAMDDWDIVAAIELIRNGDKLKSADEWKRLDQLADRLAQRHNISSSVGVGTTLWHRLRPQLIKAKLIAPENDDILVVLDDE